MTLADDIEKYILRWHSTEVREWWNMRDGSPVAGAWNFYFGRHPELGDALLVKLVKLKDEEHLLSTSEAMRTKRNPARKRQHERKRYCS